MHLDPLLPEITVVALLLVVVGGTLRALRQPSVIAYLVVGVLVGPHALNLVGDTPWLGHLGSIGVLLLLFFIGLELPVAQLMSRWRLIILGTAFQTGAGLALALLVGKVLGWPLSRAVLIGFVVSLSSTAVVLTVLKQGGAMEGVVGQLSTGLLLAQDVAVIPMLLVLNLVGGETPATGELVAQGVGVVLLGGIAVWSVGRRKGPLPLRRWVQGDRELELFAAFLVGLTLALVSGALGLSTVLGAFVAGVAMQAVDDRVWIAHRLEPFHDLLVGAFFLAVGAQIDLGFLWEHLSVVVGLVVGAVLLKTLINALIFGAAGLGWREAVVGGALMSPIGEFSLVLAGVGLQAGLIQTWGYQLTLAIISLSLIVAPVYGSVMRRRGSEA